MSYGGKGNARKNENVFFEFLLGGCSSGGAALITHPIDLIKVRKQLLGEQIKGVKTNSFTIGVEIVKQEGFFGLYKGLSASLMRQFTYSSARIGSYPFIKDLFHKDKTKPLYLYIKVISAMIAGVFGSCVGSAFDLVNIRMQANAKLPKELQRNYKNAFDGIYQIIKGEGFLKLWTGFVPNTIRSIKMNVGQLTSYDQIKQILLIQFQFKDNLILHFSASSFAGLIATIICSPIDVVKTRMMNQNKNKKNL